MTDPIRILIVDDEAPNMKALCHTLRDQGYATDGFTSGLTALQEVSPKRYDLLLTDLMMPGMDGITLLQSAMQRDPDIVGIVMTGAGTISSAVEAMKAGAFDYLLKPFTLGVLLPVVARALGVRTLRLENAALQQGMRERTEALEVANRELEAFSYSASHDLHAPLRSINLYSSILEEDHGAALDDDARRILGRIRANAMRMGQLISDLLVLSRMSRSSLTIEAVDLTAIAKEVIASLRELEPQRHAEVVIAEGMAVRGDRGLLRVLLDNVLGNAWKYSGKQPAPRIEMGVVASEHHAQTIFVRDNGAGFDMAFAKDLFAPFHRMHKADDFPGSGIGLSIVARIIQRHGGRIWAESAVNQGATFSFTLEAPARP
jgi:signal transduction histidine kinase